MKIFNVKGSINSAIISAGILCLILLVVFGFKLAILDKADFRLCRENFTKLTPATQCG
jgi:hypothetical protein